MSQKRIYIYLTAILFFLCLVVAVWWIETRPPAVDFAKVEKGKAVEAIYATAIVEPVTWSAISPIKTGRIVEVNVEEGGVVKEGDVLARLDDADLRAHLREEQELARYYTDNLERSKVLLDKGFDSVEKFDARKTDLIRSKAHISMLEEQIRQLSLTAPMDGTVLWRDVELGEVKEAGAPIFWVGQPRPLRLEAEVDEEDVPKIKAGQNVLITADAFPGEYMEGHIHWISPKGDPVNKSYRVYVTLPEDTRLMIGMTVETNTVVQEKEKALLVPAEAVIDGNNLWLAVPEGKKHIAQKRSVKIGIRGEEQVETLEGVEEGSLVILPPFDDLAEGAVVRVR